MYADCLTNIPYYDLDIDECVSNPCENSGTCADAVNSYTCSCVAGFTGTNCETSKYTRQRSNIIKNNIIIY